MQNVHVYIKPQGILGSLCDLNGITRNAPNPTLTRGTQLTLSLHLLKQDNTPYTASDLTYAKWEFVLANDWDPATPPMIRVTEGITVSEGVINIPILETNTTQLIAALGSSASIELGAELAGMPVGSDVPEFLLQFSVTANNRRGDTGLGALSPDPAVIPIPDLERAAKNGEYIRCKEGENRTWKTIDESLVRASAKGIANGVASLDAKAKIPISQIPDGIGGGLTNINDFDHPVMGVYPGNGLNVVSDTGIQCLSLDIGEGLKTMGNAGMGEPLRLVVDKVALGLLIKLHSFGKYDPSKSWLYNLTHFNGLKDAPAVVFANPDDYNGGGESTLSNYMPSYEPGKGLLIVASIDSGVPNPENSSQNRMDSTAFFLCNNGLYIQRGDDGAWEKIGSELTNLVYTGDVNIKTVSGGIARDVLSSSGGNVSLGHSDDKENGTTIIRGRNVRIFTDEGGGLFVNNIPVSGGGLSDAPADNELYVRRNGAWTNIQNTKKKRTSDFNNFDNDIEDGVNLFCTFSNTTFSVQTGIECFEIYIQNTYISKTLYTFGDNPNNSFDLEPDEVCHVKKFGSRFYFDVLGKILPNPQPVTHNFNAERSGFINDDFYIIDLYWKLGQEGMPYFIDVGAQKNSCTYVFAFKVSGNGAVKWGGFNWIQADGSLSTIPPNLAPDYVYFIQVTIVKHNLFDTAHSVFAKLVFKFPVTL